MKTKELIRQLQEADPTGEVECCIGNADIHFVARMPAYWDGRLQVLNRNEEEKKYYNIIGAKYIEKGDKIKICALSIQDLLADEPDVEIDYSGLTNATRYKEADDRIRAVGRDIAFRCELQTFLEWAEDKARVITEHLEGLKDAATDFFGKNLSPNDPLWDLPATKHEDGTRWPSVVKRRAAQWDATIEISWSGLDWIFAKKETI